MKRLRFIACVLAVGLPLCARGAFEGIAAGGVEVGLAGATVALRTGRPAANGNPAGLSGISGFTLTASACPALFGIQELSSVASSAGLALPWGGIGGSAWTLGLPGYRETTASLSCAYDGEPGWTAGIRVNLLVLSIAGYGSTAVAAYDAGARVECLESIAFGVLLTNIGGTRIGEQQESLPRSLECGFSYAPDGSGVLVCASAVHEFLSPVDWRLGVAYSPYECLVLRTGISTEPSLLCGGFGVALSPVSIDYAVSHHWQLGLTHHVSVTVALG